MPPRRGVVAVVVRWERLLVIRRSDQVTAPRAFCFPGGGIEPGESEAEALVREMDEELDVVARPVRCLWQSRTVRDVQLAWWLTELPPEFTLQPDQAEVESVPWMTPEEMLALAELLESNRQFMRAASAGEFTFPLTESLRSEPPSEASLDGTGD